MVDRLTRYRDKRDPKATTEPFGVAEPRGETTAGLFVVHEHHATQRHFDLRIEIAGALESFAVPKGPTFNPDIKRFAAHTEPHPLEYIDFEGIIPEANYGAGEMIAWDIGEIEYLDESAEKGLAKGKLDFLLRGYKLRGRFALVKLKTEKSGWLLIKKRDVFARDEEAIDAHHSVLSGLTAEELLTYAKICDRWATHTVSLSSAKLSNKTRAVPFVPQSVVPKGATLFCPWLRGVHVVAEKTADRVTITDDAGVNVAPLYPELVRSLVALPVSAIALEGDLTIAGTDGIADANLLSARSRAFEHELPAALPRPLATLVVMDVVNIVDYELTGVPFEARHAILTELLAHTAFLRLSPFSSDASMLVEFARAHGQPGLRAFDARSPSARWAVLVGSPPPAEHPSVGADAKPQVALTNAAKVLYPAVNGTKLDVFRYYEAIAPVLLPYLRDRPVVVVRYPDGVEKKSFFQWNPPRTMPSWVGSIELPSEDGSPARRAFVVSDLESLLYLANLACLSLHILPWRTHERSRFDYAVIDVDVKQSSLEVAKVIMRELKWLVDEAAIPCVLKTSGQTGLHVYFPMSAPAEIAMGFTKLIAEWLVSRRPDLATTERRVSARGDRVFLDCGQIGPTRTLIAPYSLRATALATASTPFAWEELDALDPTLFTMHTMHDRIASKGDLMKSLLLPELEPLEILSRVERSMARAK